MYDIQKWSALHIKAAEIEELSLKARKWAFSLNAECDELQKRVKELEGNWRICVNRNNHAEAQVYVGTIAALSAFSNNPRAYTAAFDAGLENKNEKN